MPESALLASKGQPWKEPRGHGVQPLHGHVTNPGRRAEQPAPVTQLVGHRGTTGAQVT